MLGFNVKEGLLVIGDLLGRIHRSQISLPEADVALLTRVQHRYNPRTESPHPARERPPTISLRRGAGGTRCRESESSDT